MLSSMAVVFSKQGLRFHCTKMLHDHEVKMSRTLVSLKEQVLIYTLLSLVF